VCRSLALQVFVSNGFCAILVMASRPDSCADASRRQHGLKHELRLQGGKPGGAEPSLGYEALVRYGSDTANDIKNFSNEATLLNGNGVEAQESSKKYAIKLQEANNKLRDLRDGTKAFVGIVSGEHTQHVKDIKDRLNGQRSSIGSGATTSMQSAKGSSITTEAPSSLKVGGSTPNAGSGTTRSTQPAKGSSITTEAPSSVKVGGSTPNAGESKNQQHSDSGVSTVECNSTSSSSSSKTKCRSCLDANMYLTCPGGKTLDKISAFYNKNAKVNTKKCDNKDIFLGPGKSCPVDFSETFKKVCRDQKSQCIFHVQNHTTRKTKDAKQCWFRQMRVTFECKGPA